MRDTKLRFQATLNQMRPVIRDAFMQAIEDVKRTADVDQIVRMLEQSDVAGVLEVLNLSTEYFEPLAEAVRTAFIEGGNYTGSSIPKRNPATGQELVIRFSGRHPRAEGWVATRSSDLIVEITDKQRTAIRDVLMKNIAQGVSPKKAALDLVGRVKGGKRTGGILGLTEHEMGQVSAYRTKLEGQGRKTDQIDRMVQKYTNKRLRQRGERIARTETIAAMNAGRLEGVLQMIEAGHVQAEAVTKTWDATGDVRTRHSHMEMDGQVQAIDQPFTSPTGAQMQHPGDSSLGVGAKDVVHCRCYLRIVIDWFFGLESK